MAKALQGAAIPSATLTIHGQLSLLGNTTKGVVKNGTNGSYDSIAGVTTPSFGGILNVKLLAGTLAAGDTFNLFRAAQFSGAFQSVSLPSLAAGLYWDTTEVPTTGTLAWRTVAVARQNDSILGLEASHRPRIWVYART